ncbi:MAG TPA: AAA family ATPase [Caldimonas sp.]|jgi:type II secretory pathway predicted ATPase ExeA|nr:AAA family ATPase [Caldimonas sp.]HEX2540143.1 AAA family ATPase [Caldimonas sp.]
MDDQHFRLRGIPAEFPPDADGGVDCRSQGRALAYLRHAVLQGDSFVVLTGEAGMGKTALLRRLLQSPASDTLVSAFLAARRFDTAALLAAVSRAFGAPVDGHSAAELRAGLQAFLATLTASGRRALLVVDDAQQLPATAVTELIELSKLRSRRDAPLQIVLAGRTELRSMLQRSLLIGTAEPIFLFCEVGPLGAGEVRAYVAHRMCRAQPDACPSLSEDACNRIHRTTGGVPAAIDQLCDRLLAAAQPRQLQRITSAAIDRALTAEPPPVPADAGAADVSAESPIEMEAAANGRRRTAVRSARAAGSGPRGAVLLVTVLVMASLIAGVVHEYHGVLAEARLSSLAQATRVAPAAAPDVLPAVPPALPPVLQSAAQPAVPPLAVPAAAAVAAETARVSPADAVPVAAAVLFPESNPWQALPPEALVPPAQAPESPAEPAAALQPGPVVEACSAAVIALGLCSSPGAP